MLPTLALTTTTRSDDVPADLHADIAAAWELSQRIEWDLVRDHETGRLRAQFLVDGQVAMEWGLANALALLDRLAE